MSPPSCIHTTNVGKTDAAANGFMKAHIETMRTKNQVRCEADIFKLLGLRRYYPPHDRNDRLGMCVGVGRLVMCVLGRGG